MTQTLHFRFGAVEVRKSKDQPGKPGQERRWQKGLLVWPPSEDLTDMGKSLPVEVMLRDGQEPHDPRKRFKFTGHHLESGDFGSLSVNLFAPMVELEEEGAASKPIPLSQQASPTGARSPAAAA